MRRGANLDIGPLEKTPEVIDTQRRGAGYFVLVAVLLLATAGALVLIVGPLALARLRRRERPEHDEPTPGFWTFGYFGLLGLAAISRATRIILSLRRS